MPDNDQSAMVNSEQWDDVSYVISSQYRAETLKQLTDGPATPSMIAEEVKRSISHVSKALGELRDRGLVQLLVSEDRKKGRVYGITERGLSVWAMIEENNIA